MTFRASCFSLGLVALIAAPLAAQGAMQVAPSGRSLTEVTLTLVDSAARASAKPSVIRIDFGQPHLRGRPLFTDSLVPYDKPWRLGANDPTTLTTDVDLVIGGQAVPKGKWVLQALPSRAGWKLLVQKDPAASPMAAGAPAAPATDIARVDLRLSALTTPLESLTMWLIPSRAAGAPHGELRLAWGNVMLSAPWSVKQ